jgi:hypothetical protein
MCTLKGKRSRHCFQCIFIMRNSRFIHKLTIWLLVTRTCSWATKLLWLTAPWISHQQRTIILYQDILYLFLWRFIHICPKKNIYIYAINSWTALIWTSTTWLTLYCTLKPSPAVHIYKIKHSRQQNKEKHTTVITQMQDEVFSLNLVLNM